MAHPTLLEQVSETMAIDNIQRIGDVGTTNDDLLRRLLPHCTAENLEHIETSTTGRDLSHITDELWRQHFGRKFGPHHLDLVQERMASAKRTFLWRRLYKAKIREQDEMEKEGVGRLSELYREQLSKKVNRQCLPIDMIPPGESKRARTTLPLSTAGGAGSGKGAAQRSNSKVTGSPNGRLMQKSRMDFARRKERMRKCPSMRSNVNNGINPRPRPPS